MNFNQPRRSMAALSANMDLLNTAINSIKGVMMTLPNNEFIETDFKPQIDKENLKDIKLGCMYAVHMGHNESEWLLKMNYQDKNPRTLTNETIKGFLESCKPDVIEVRFDLIYNIKKQAVAVKIISIFHRNTWENEIDGIIVPGYNNVYEKLRKQFSWFADAKSQTSVRRKSFDLEWFRRTLTKMFEAISQDSLGLADQTINMSQTEKALSVMK